MAAAAAAAPSPEGGRHADDEGGTANDPSLSLTSGNEGDKLTGGNSDEDDDRDDTEASVSALPLASDVGNDNDLPPPTPPPPPPPPLLSAASRAGELTCAPSYCSLQVAGSEPASAGEEAATAAVVAVITCPAALLERLLLVTSRPLLLPLPLLLVDEPAS